MEQHEAYDLILDLILEKGNTTPNNVKYYLPAFSETSEASIALVLEDMYNLAQKAFDLKTFHKLPCLIKNPYTRLLKESGGFARILNDRKKAEPVQTVVFQKADGNNPLADLHPTVQMAASALFRNGHFRQAILDTYIALIEAVKNKSGINQDGVSLMNLAFSPNKPVLIVSDDPDEQKGFLWLFNGAVMGVRNVNAHRLIQQEDPHKTLEWLSFASVLFRVLDEVRIS